MSALAQLKAHSYVGVPPEVLADNLVSALGRGLPTVDYGKPLPQKVAVVAGGPSVRDHINELKEFDGFIVSINGAHDWLIDRGIIPDGVIVLDGLPSVADFFTNPQDDTAYFVSSSCAPEVFDVLDQNKVILWHTNSEYGLSVCTGPSALCSAPYLLYMIGFRDIHLYGADSSLSALQSHVYSSGSVSKDRFQVRAGNEVFISTGAFILQAEHLWNLTRVLPDIIHIHGYGLAKSIIDANGDFEVI